MSPSKVENQRAGVVTEDEVSAAPLNRSSTRKAPRRVKPRASSMPVLVIDSPVLMPHMQMPFPVEDGETAMALERALKSPSRQVLLLMEVPVMVEDASVDGYYESGSGSYDRQHDDAQSTDFEFPQQQYGLASIGVIAHIRQSNLMLGGERHVVLEGLSRGSVKEYLQELPFLIAKVDRLEDPSVQTPDANAAMLIVVEQTEAYLDMLPHVPEEIIEAVRSVTEPGQLADLVAFSPEFNPSQRQELLEILDPVKRLRRLSIMLAERQIVMNIRQDIHDEAQAGMDRQQREFYLREQMRAIQKELGEGSSEEVLATEMREKIEAAGMPEEVKQKALVQVERLEQQHPFSPEIGIIRSYLEWLTELPWSVETEDRLNLEEAALILESDHYGLEKVKERIIEYIAVRKLAGDRQRAPIICFVGPPGVGKTSLGRSIARAIDRNYVRMSLGGVRDEAEIRGHRRTYVGAMPGRVIKALRDAKSLNPVLVLDEIDKVGSDAFRGDPAAALLEVLDPEQNSTFSDHYLEVPFDLSKVIFITTANVLDPIPPALRDRMEIIEVSGYTEIEKLEIARRFLLPKALDGHGLTPELLTVSDDALRRLIREYTEESGVRNLEREIGSLCRKAARKFASENAPTSLAIDAPDLDLFLGIPRYDFGRAEEQDEVGVATGAAVTSSGGDLLSIEVTVMEGKGELLLTGQLGDVMQESARAAISYARSRSADFGIPPGFFDSHNIHVHIPAGATPKDGPSAGITIATALISVLTGRKMRKDVAMTGEITLRGKVLPVGGLREKTLAAHRGGITTFILPKRNAKDLADLPDVVKQDLELVQAATLDDVLDVALIPASDRSLHVA